MVLFLLHHRCKDPIITHLTFADDLIAFMNRDGVLLSASHEYC